MTGIEVLATQEVATEFAFNWTAFWIVFGIIFCMSAILGIIISLGSRDWLNLFITIMIGLICGVIIGIPISGTAFAIPIAYETQYKVVVSDEVPMNEFLEKYEIIDQEGKIFTVVERND